MKNLAGCKVGEWTVKCEGERKSGKRSWWCECSCGIIKEVLQSNLTTGKSKKCLPCSLKTTRFKHGLSHNTSGLYSVWRNMKSRCLNKNSAAYKNYGGRGIKICERWLEFNNFLGDMGPSFEEGLTLDRVDNSGNYSPENCRWATKTQQNSNTRRTLNLEYKGAFYTEAELSKATGVNRTTIQARRNRGLIGEDLVNGPREV